MILEPVQVPVIINTCSFDYLTLFKPVKTGLDDIRTSSSLSFNQLWFIDYATLFEPVETGLDDIKTSSSLISNKLWFI